MKHFIYHLLFITEQAEHNPDDNDDTFCLHISLQLSLRLKFNPLEWEFLRTKDYLHVASW